jgi:hypothetical protein
VLFFRSDTYHRIFTRSYIHDLESKLAKLQREMSSQKSIQIEEAEGQLATLSREKTVRV